MKRGATLLLLGLAAACAPKEEAKPVLAPEPPRRHEGPKLAVQQELGSIDPGDVQRAWSGLQAAFLGCKKRGTARVEYLAGDVKFFLRLGPNGRVKWSYLEDSTLGDRETEKCLLDVLAGAQWPKPEGGDAEVRNSLGFDPDGRAPNAWSSDKLASLLGKNDRDLVRCKKGLKEPMHVTLYIEPHNKEGRVQAVGVSLPAKGAEDAIDCVVNEVKGWKVPSPGSWAAKVEFKV
jgi:hypothetical protein